MLKNKASCLNKVWTTYSIKMNSGVLKKIRIIDMPIDKYEEYIDFKMKYYVKYELTHRISGIPNSTEAMEEYREILSKTYKDTSIKKVIGYLEDGNDSKIIGISAQKLIKINDSYEEIKAHTEPVKKYYKILTAWNNLFPVPELMKKYGISSYYDDMGIATHPLYRGTGFAYKMAPIRRHICKRDNVPMTGAWMSSYGTQKAVTRDGWEIVYEINYEELSRILGIKFEYTHPTSTYMIARV